MCLLETLVYNVAKRTSGIGCLPKRIFLGLGNKKGVALFRPDELAGWFYRMNVLDTKGCDWERCLDLHEL